MFFQFLNLFYFIFLNFFLERVQAGGGGAEGEGENLKQTPC